MFACFLHISLQIIVVLPALQFSLNLFEFLIVTYIVILHFFSLSQIPNHVAIKIALELKKLLIDNSLLDVYVINWFFTSILCGRFLYGNAEWYLWSSCSSQNDLEANLFKVCIINQKLSNNFNLLCITNFSDFG